MLLCQALQAGMLRVRWWKLFFGEATIAMQEVYLKQDVVEMLGLLPKLLQHEGSLGPTP